MVKELTPGDITSLWIGFCIFLAAVAMLIREIRINPRAKRLLRKAGPQQNIHDIVNRPLR